MVLIKICQKESTFTKTLNLMTLSTTTSDLNEVIRFFHMTEEIAVPFIVPKSESVNTYYLNITNS